MLDGSTLRVRSKRPIVGAAPTPPQKRVRPEIKDNKAQDENEKQGGSENQDEDEDGYYEAHLPSLLMPATVVSSGAGRKAMRYAIMEVCDLYRQGRMSWSDDGYE